MVVFEVNCGDLNIIKYALFYRTESLGLSDYAQGLNILKKSKKNIYISYRRLGVQLILILVLVM